MQYWIKSERHKLNTNTFHFKTKLWTYSGKATWYFVSVPKKIAKEIEFFASMGKRRGWGSVKVDVTIGSTSWSTSIFPSDDDAYILPIKSSVRKAESLVVDKSVAIALTPHYPV